MYFAAINLEPFNSPDLCKFLTQIQLRSYPMWATWKDSRGKPHLRTSPCLIRMQHFLNFSGLPSCCRAPCPESQIGSVGKRAIWASLSPLSNEYCLSRANWEPRLISCSFFFNIIYLCPKRPAYLTASNLNTFVASCRAACLMIRPLCLVGRLCAPGLRIWSW